MDILEEGSAWRTKWRASPYFGVKGGEWTEWGWFKAVKRQSVDWHILHQGVNDW